MVYFWWVAGWYVAMSVVSFCVYWADKRRARKQQWRIKERTLHTLDAMGGWPGGLAAQRLFRHKTRDMRFRMIFGMIVASHALAWIGGVWLLTRA